MKLLISEAQLEVLIGHINKSSQPIRENWREVVLGTAMLMGIKLTGVNAQTASNALNNAEVIQKIGKTLSGPEIEKLANTLEESGLEGAMDKLQANNFKIETNLSLAAEELGLITNISIYNTEKTTK